MKIKQNFEQFHNDNPHVLNQLISMLDAAKLVGRRKVGMKQLFEVLRWNQSLSTKASDFKLNNNYTAYYTRLIDKSRPDLGELLTRRSSGADHE